MRQRRRYGAFKFPDLFQAYHLACLLYMMPVLIPFEDRHRPGGWPRHCMASMCLWIGANLSEKQALVCLEMHKCECKLQIEIFIQQKGFWEMWKWLWIALAARIAQGIICLNACLLSLPLPFDEFKNEIHRNLFFHSCTSHRNFTTQGLEAW